MYWIHAEDFVSAFIGPFNNAEDAQQHIDEVIVPRGDSSVNHVIDQNVFDELSPGWLIMSPEKDLEYDPTA